MEVSEEAHAMWESRVDGAAVCPTVHAMREGVWTASAEHAIRLTGRDFAGRDVSAKLEWGMQT